MKRNLKYACIVISILFTNTYALKALDMGCVAVPPQTLINGELTITTSDWLEAFELMKNNADYVLHHTGIDWAMFVQGSDIQRDAATTPHLESTNFIAGMAELKGLKTFIVLDPISQNREEIDPLAIGPDFNDGNVRNAFKNYAVRIARDYKPVYMGLLPEANTYITKHPDDADNIISLYKETYDLVKQESPQTIVTATFQLEAMAGAAGNNPQWEIIDLFEPKLDVIAVTTYPSFFFDNPDALPNTYYSQIAQHTSKPIIFAESGWSSGGDVQFHGSYENQERFLRRIVELTSDIDLRLWIWWFLHDQRIEIPGNPIQDWFKTLGLRESDGTAKLSWITWQEIYGNRNSVNQYYIRGFIKDAEGISINEVTVTLSGDVDAVTTTDENGLYGCSLKSGMGF